MDEGKGVISHSTNWAYGRKVSSNKEKNMVNSLVKDPPKLKILLRETTNDKVLSHAVAIFGPDGTHKKNPKAETFLQLAKNNIYFLD